LNSLFRGNPIRVLYRTYPTNTQIIMNAKGSEACLHSWAWLSPPDLLWVGQMIADQQTAKRTGCPDGQRDLLLDHLVEAFLYDQNNGSAYNIFEEKYPQYTVVCTLMVADQLTALQDKVCSFDVELFWLLIRITGPRAWRTYVLATGGVLEV